MDLLQTVEDPQLLIAVGALITLTLALCLEAVVLMHSLSPGVRTAGAAPGAALPDPLPHDFDDWLYE